MSTDFSYRKDGVIMIDLHKPVHVRSYRRFRLGSWENVCEHFRSMPTR